MLQTVLHDWHVNAGARMVDFAGWRMPIQYASIVEEHHAVRQRAGLFDISHMGRLWFRGPDQIRFLDHLLTNHVEKLRVGQVRYSLVCREDGGILDDVLIYRFSDRCLLVVNGANREKIVDWIGKYLDGFDVTLQDETLSSAMLALQGPRALDLLQPLIETPLGDMRYYEARESLTTRNLIPGVMTEGGSVDGTLVVVSRTGYTGEDGFEVILPLEQGVPFWTQLLAAAGEHLTPCGLGCRDTLRLEAAMPLYGHEMDETVDPFTAGLSFGVKLAKENFIGRAALVAKQHDPALPKRVGVELTGRRIAREGALLMHNGSEVGRVTSGTFSPTLDKSIAMGYLTASAAEPGTDIEVDIRGKREPARVVSLPFYKRPQS